MLTPRWKRPELGPAEAVEWHPYPDEVPPEWARVAARPRGFRVPQWAAKPSGEDSPEELHSFAWGWPAVSLAGGVHRRYLRAPDGSLSGISEENVGFWWVPQGPLRGNRLPYLPAWPGFALDTVFYGTLAFLLWSAPGFVRRTRRRRRGLCVACGYELKGTPKCPECGL
jgi:hypothetical protein